MAKCLDYNFELSYLFCAEENEEENEACEKAEDNKIEDVNDNSKNENLEQIKEDIVEEK